MQRFGRTAQAKMKDGWGGSFILAAILALALAYWAGNAISQKFGGLDSAGSSLNGAQPGSPSGSTPGSAAFVPRQYELYFVQPAAFMSDSKAQDMVRTLSDHNYSAMVTAPDKDNLTHVYAGVFTSRASAESAKAKLAADGIASNAIIKTVTVDHNPEAVPALSVASKPVDVRSGLDALNTYLYEAALFIEGRTATGSTDATYVTRLGQQLATLATGMAAEKDAKVKKFADVASAASVNARAFGSAASAAASSDEYQQAMSGYLSLLEQYSSLQTAK